MTVTTLLPRMPFTKNLREVLEQAVGKPVGWGRIPMVDQGDAAHTLVPAERTYLILYSLWATTSGPPFAAPDADARWIYQVSIYAERADQLELFQDKVLRVFLDRDGDTGAFVHDLDVPAADGKSGIHRTDTEKTEDSGAPADVTDDQTLDLRFGVDVTPRAT